MPEVMAHSKTDLIEEATLALQRCGLERPRREALALASWAFGQSPADVLLSREGRPGPGAADSLRWAVRRRAAGHPAAHVTGETGFRYLTLRCDDRALIPRPETELLIDLILRRVSTGVAADLGTGSGCLALSLAQEGDFNTVLAIDSSSDALSLARENAASTGLTILPMLGDLASALGPGSVDALVANPPYLTTTEYRRLDPSVRQWEPRQALESGLDGLEATRSIITQAVGCLRGGGWLGLEVDNSRASVVARLASEAGLTAVVVERDLFARERFVLAQRRFRP